MEKSQSNIAKWLIVIFLVASGIAANYYFVKIPLSQRLIGWLLLLATTLFVVAQTNQGVFVRDFAKQARLEMHKVVWPTRQETIQTTMIVIAMVIVVGIVLWGIDGVLLRAVGALTGQGG